jgi:formate dehydrogenase iron-sulfur subunit
MNKCWLCFDRLSAGEEPACVKACKTEAITFGQRDEIIAEAEDRLYKNPGLYIPKIYGKTEVGGTSMMYLSNVPFEKLGFDMTLPTKPVKIARAEIAPTFKEFVAMAGTGPAVFVLGVGWVIRRRMEAEAEAKNA